MSIISVGARISGETPLTHKTLIQGPTLYYIFQSLPIWDPQTLEGKLCGEGSTF